MSSVEIVAKQIIFTAKKIKIDVMNLELNKSSIIIVKVLDEVNRFISQDEFLLDGEEYAEWVNDDWLIDYVCNKYGYERENPDIQE